LSAKFQFDYSQITEFEKRIERLPRRLDGMINEVLHSDGIEITTDEITKELPVSSWRNKVRNKIHAKNSNWSASEKQNLGFVVKSRGGAAKNKGSFGYLVFPNEGRGAHNPLEQRFMELGLEKAVPKIMERLNRKIDEFLEEEL